VALAYTYLASAFIGMAINRVRHRDGRHADEPPAVPVHEKEPIRKNQM